jgi:voltage-gated potassium channel
MEQERNDREKRDADYRQRADSERWELLDNIQSMVEPVMALLGVVFVALLFVDLSGVVQGTGWSPAVSRAQTAIWVIFIVEFAARLFIAPSKLTFLRTNWFSALSLALPFLRPCRALRLLRTARAARSLSLVRLLGGLNRGMRVLRRAFGGHVFAYVLGLTIVVALGGAVGVWYFDRDRPDSPIQSFGDALWWSTALVTTINNEKFAVSTEARVLAILIRVFAISVFGFITARFATYLIGEAAEESGETENTSTDVAALRHEIALLRAELAEHRTGPPVSHIADR